VAGVVGDLDGVAPSVRLPVAVCEIVLLLDDVGDADAVADDVGVEAAVPDDERVSEPEMVYDGELVAVATAVLEKDGGDVDDADEPVGVADAVAAGEPDAVAVADSETDGGADGVNVTDAVVLADTNSVMDAVDVGEHDAVPEGVPPGDTLAVALADRVCVGERVAGGGMAQTSVSFATVCKP
jgi:hypothetical protein